MFDLVMDEILGKDGKRSKSDQQYLTQMLKEINQDLHIKLLFLYEIDEHDLSKATKIIERYIEYYEDPLIKVMLLVQINNKTNKYEELDLKLYDQFVKSNKYISKGNESAPVAITARYDDIFTKYVSNKFLLSNTSIFMNPRNIVYLPQTFLKVCKTKDPKIVALIGDYLSGKNQSKKHFGFVSGENSYPSYQDCLYDLLFYCLEGIKNYPAYTYVKLVEQYCSNDRLSLQNKANEVKRYLLDHLEYK